jgi:uncharacterized damage-inducible protein DinB
MDLLDRLLGHDAWTTRQLLLLCRDMPDAQLDTEFDISHRTVRATFLHIIWNMEAWSDQIAGRAIRPKLNALPEGRSALGMLARLDGAAADLAAVAHRIAARNAWDELWRDVPDDPTTENSYGGAILHVITHSMHHRAQLIYMLKQLGVKDLPEGDVLSWEQALKTSGGTA